MRITLSTGTPAELVRPVGTDPVGGLVLWPDVVGLRPLFDDHARRCADRLSMVVVAPEPFPGEEASPVEERLVSAGRFSDADKLADGVAAADATGFDRVATLGFCMGGMFAMKSLASDRFVRAVAFYGMVRMPPQWKGDGRADAVDIVADRAARGDLELLCIFGTNDPWCPGDQIDEIEAAGASVVRYEGADHGWAQDPSRANYRPDDAADAFARADAFLAVTSSGSRVRGV